MHRWDRFSRYETLCSVVPVQNGIKEKVVGNTLISAQSLDDEPFKEEGRAKKDLNAAETGCL